MGKKGKVGKQRKDNYYRLAKQKGFRSRAAFKLIQLNRKFQFLENSRVCIDLCAAPGGWLQVCSEYMPVSSVIVGVDLVPITPVRNTITFQSDITTAECSKEIEERLANWKADVVLHDGAPNVGKNWLHDAYGQNVLVVNALKIACNHLNKGGWFVTKIFRSSDYNSLLWVFGKLFGKVHATKPQASRQESAEIFVVCQNYRAPSEIDPKFFDPSALFADISNFDETLKKQKADLLKPANKVKKTKAHGYEDVEALKIVTDVNFVTGSNHMDYLAQCHEIRFTNDDISKHDATNEEIRECCKDLKVLGKKDLLRLLKWRRTIRKDLYSNILMAMEKSKSKSNITQENQEDQDESGVDIGGDILEQLTLPSDDDDEEAEPELQLDDIEAQQDEEKRKELRRQKRKEEKRVKDYQQRVQYGMVNQGDVLIEEEHDLFNLSRIDGRDQLAAIDDASPDDLVEVPTDPKANLGLDSGKLAKAKKVSFSRVADVKYFEKENDYDDDDEEASHPSNDEAPQKQSEATIKTPKNILKNTDAGGQLKRLGTNPNAGGGLLTDLMDINESKVAAATRFFDKDDFSGVDLESQFEMDLVNKIARSKIPTKMDVCNEDDEFEVVPAKDFPSDDDEVDDGNNELQIRSDDDSEDEDSEPKRKQVKLDPEGLALATMMVSSEKARKNIEDEGWNRYSHADAHLAPKWFRDDEAKHCRRNIPVTPEMVQDYKQRLREIDAKPIKKVMQAKARKKRRALKKMDRVKKKVESITANEDITQRERINQIKTVYKNATKTKKKEVKLVVGRKGLPTKRPGKSKYKMVDSRLKKDLRAKRRQEAAAKGGRKSGKGFKRSSQRRPNKSSSSSGSASRSGRTQKVKAKKGSKGHKRK